MVTGACWLVRELELLQDGGYYVIDEGLKRTGSRGLALCLITLFSALATAGPAPDAGPVGAVGEAPSVLAVDDPTLLLLLRADAIFEDVQRQRGLRVSEPVGRAVTGRDEVIERLLEIVDREIPLEVREAQDRLARALGIVPPSVGFFDAYMELLRREVAGFYDDETRTFYILDDTPPGLQSAVMAHELFHAVQDQTWGLSALLGEGRWVTDVALAAQALLEGDALAVMAGFMLEDPGQITRDSVAQAGMRMSLSSSSGAPNDGTPSFLWEQLVFPYVTGIGFVFSLVAPDDWSAVDAAYASPPRSTEQVLHPERFAELDAPTWLEFDASVDDGERYAADVLGEFATGAMFRQLLADLVSSSSIDRAVEGWDGDRLEAWRLPDDPGRDRVVWLSVWDTVEDAEAFAVVTSRLTTPWLGTRERRRLEGAAGESWRSETETGAMVVERWGDLVLVVLDAGGEIGPEARDVAVEAVIEAVWSTHTRSRYPEF